MDPSAPKVHKKTSFWICVVLAVFYLGYCGAKLSSVNIYEREGWPQLLIVGLFFTGLAIWLKHRNDAEAAAYAAWVEERRDTERLIREKLVQEHQTAEARQAAWESTHGRIVTQVAGVTFDNEDGTSRQRALKGAYVNGGEGTLDLEQFEYKGEPAIRVIYEGVCVGNIPRAKVPEVLPILAKISAAHLDVEPFDATEDRFGNEISPERIYRADLTIVYNKTAPD